MNTKGVKAASFPAVFTASCHPRTEDLSPTQRSGVAIGNHQTLHQGTAAASSASQLVPSQPCSPGSRSAPAAGTAPPFHCTWFRFTSPLSLLSSHPPPTQSVCHAPVCPTRKLANRTAKPAPQPLGPIPPTITPGSAAGPAAVAASPPCLRRRCHCFLPTRSTRQRNPTQSSGVENGRPTQSQSAAAACPASQLVPLLPCSPGSRSRPAAGAVPPFHCTWFRFTLALPLLFCLASANATVFQDPCCPTRLKKSKMNLTPCCSRKPQFHLIKISNKY